MNPEEILTKKALSMPHRTYTTAKQTEEQIETLSTALRDMMRKELLDMKANGIVQVCLQKNLYERITFC